MTSRLALEYDGGGFAGWAKQPDLRTVQGEVERALGVVLRRGEVSVTVAGRTDAGVHALGQVCSYGGDPAPLARLNALLPPDVAALVSEPAPEGFDARRDATSRAYCYRVLARPSRSPVWAGRALHWPHQVPLSALQHCAHALVGRHDFTAFTPTQTEHVHFERQVLAAEWGFATVQAPHAAGHSELLEFWVEADAFMRQMNRILVGTMLEVAAGRRTVESFVGLLDGRPRPEAGPTAPPHGLYLAGVGYEGRRLVRAPSPSESRRSLNRRIGRSTT